jgi:hypothetical protein
MLYIIHDTLLKVSLYTNKTDQHVIRYTWHIVESVIKHHDTFNNMLGITDNMLASFIGA